MADFAAMRQHMVEGQIEPNQVNDPRILAAFADVPRELFVPKAKRPIAYVDEDLEIAPGRFLMEPAIFARLIQAAFIRPEDVVLDVGCGTGYSSAVLAKLAGTVVGLESDAPLAEQADAILNELGVDNAVTVVGPLGGGYASQGPYDVIVIEGGVETIPAPLEEQLAEGGRLLAVEQRTSRGPGKATLVARTRGRVSSRVLFDASVPRLEEFLAPRGFVF
ncbi:MAG: protein-L-isoaspartate O-methyltransferase [Rhodospirillaceae bacterium]|nr:protein-L-isoaspartate O-methyltransferase [Rhodospirillaceae bacterium]